MTSLFDAIELDDRTNQSISRKAVVLANHRVDQRLGNFVKAASTSDEREARLSLVQDDLESIVAGACQEIGSGDPAKIAAQIRTRLAEVEDAGHRTASVHEARRPKLCPYHAEVVDISLAQGEPQSGYTAMAQHAWGEQHCKGGYEGRCNFKPAMTTQTFWDEKAEAADQRRQERAEQLEQAQQQPEQLDAEIEVEPEAVEAPAEGITESPESEGGEVLQFPSEERSDAPEATPEVEVPMAMAASADDAVPLDGSPRSKTADLEKLAPGKQHLPAASPKRNRQYEHILESCKKEHPDYDLDRCKELAARTVNKTRAEHGETKSHSIHASITHNSWGNPGDGYNDHMDEVGDYPEAEPEPPICPNCGGPGNFLGGLGRLNHYRCRNCGLDFNEPAHPHDDDREPGYHGYASVREAAEPQGDHLGPIKREKVDQGGDGPEPKIDKSKWTPDSVPELHVDDASGSHPTKRKDILDVHSPSDREGVDEIGEQVTERQDVTEGTEQSHSGQGGTFPKGNQADAVTSAKLVDDVDKNPLQSLIEGDYDGFTPEVEIQRAISSYRR